MAEIATAADALANTAYKLYKATKKRMPHPRLEAWKEAAASITETALKHKLTMPDDRIPGYLSHYSVFASILQQLDDCYDEQGNSIKGSDFMDRWSLSKDLHRAGKELRNVMLVTRSKGAYEAFTLPSSTASPSAEDNAPADIREDHPKKVVGRFDGVIAQSSGPVATSPGRIPVRTEAELKRGVLYVSEFFLEA
ncbi:hypothetical protein B0H17DRAFT_1217063 [Mycena rosella]|uniref:Uncharacterized protein n=1 Tax=Mycena rosella TaxID=1033263 RepID=A0AAD7C4K2_MYCRO|nr:hypothetical protein B0H17DRAFT_1217063 [Mycena rosella]